MGVSSKGCSRWVDECVGVGGRECVGVGGCVCVLGRGMPDFKMHAITHNLSPSPPTQKRKFPYDWFQPLL